MVILKENIDKWYKLYDYKEDSEQEIEDNILSTIDAIKNWCDFKELLLLPKKGILYWKGVLRTVHYYDCLDDSGEWKKLFEIVKCSTDKPKDTVKNIVGFSRNNMCYKGKWGGINYPVASTLVYFFSKGKCPIIDWRVVYALKHNGYGEQLKGIYLYPNKKTGSYQIYLNDADWDDYYNLCNEIVLNLKLESIGNDTALRVLDKALWKYPDLNKKKLEKVHCL
jgi:hypothetical protein